MKTKTELLNAYTVNGTLDRSRWFAALKSYRAALDDLSAKVREDITEKRTPAETVSAWVASVGYETAEIVMASMINSVGDWDARISSSVRTWAANVDEALDRDAAIDLGLYCDAIHACHKDQLAEAFMKYQPEEPQPTEPETAPTEPETSEIFSMAEMLSEEQLTAAVLRVDRTAPGAEDIARFFCQELLKRDRQKAVEVWNRWKRGETD